MAKCRAIFPELDLREVPWFDGFCTLRYFNPNACNIAKKKSDILLNLPWEDLPRPPKNNSVYFCERRQCHFYSETFILVSFLFTWSDSFTAYAVVWWSVPVSLFLFSSSDSQWGDMHVDSFIVCLFSFITVKQTNKQKKKTRSSLVFNKQWRRMDQYKTLCKCEWSN